MSKEEWGWGMWLCHHVTCCSCHYCEMVFVLAGGESDKGRV